MKDQLGPRTVEVPAHSYRTCSGCEFFKHTLIVSGQNPRYKNHCENPDVKGQERYDGLWGTGNLPDNDQHPTPHWCPFLQPKPEGCKCQACGNYFKIDVMVDDSVWEKIKPAGKPEGAGLLCGSCIFKRLEELNVGHSVVFVPEKNIRPKGGSNG